MPKRFRTSSDSATRRKLRKRMFDLRAAGAGSKAGSTAVGSGAAASSYMKRPVLNRIPRWTTTGGELPEAVSTIVRYTSEPERTAAAAATEVTINANSTFDPEGATGAGQPAMRDAMASLYYKYKVVAAKVVAVIHNVTAANTVVGLMGGYSGMAAPTPQKIRMRCHRSAVLHNSGIDGDSCTLTLYMTTKQALRYLEDSSCSADVGANPSRPWSFYIELCAQDGGTAVQFDLSYTLTQWVQWMGPQDNRAVD